MEHGARDCFAVDTKSPVIVKEEHHDKRGHQHHEPRQDDHDTRIRLQSDSIGSQCSWKQRACRA